MADRIPISPNELDEIERECVLFNKFGPHTRLAVQFVGEDLPRLISEVRRLLSDNEELKSDIEDLSSYRTELADDLNRWVESLRMTTGFVTNKQGVTIKPIDRTDFHQFNRGQTLGRIPTRECVVCGQMVTESKWDEKCEAAPPVQATKDCIKCLWSGIYNGETCSDCNGTGKVVI